MEFGLLGPLRVSVDDSDVDVPGAKERTVLAHLLAYVGRAVPTADLFESLWGEDPPRTAAKSLQTFVLCKLAQEWTYRFLAPAPPAPADVRRWAAAHDIVVSNRGRIPVAVMDQFLEARARGGI